ncbi:MAG TPA: hypothetical protein VMH77_00045, partial [Steroidobacteraceae bacterium]|nr:hypothetical protein [Steroidobacteraceae bacterium]
MFALASALAAGKATGAQDLTAFAAVGVTRDDNVFRLADDASDTDTYRVASAGLHFDLPVSAQHLTADGKVEDYRYQHFDELDHHAYNAELAWLWKLGARSEGKFDYQASSVLTSFSNLQAGVQTTTPNEEKSQQLRAEAGYGLTGTLQLRAAVDRLIENNSAEIYLPSDMRRNGAEASVAVVGRTGHRIGVQARVEDATLPNPEIVLHSLIDNSYKQRRIGPFIEWQLSDTLGLKARASRVERKYDQVAARDYLAWTWGADMTWQPDDRFTLTAQVRHDISDHEEINVGLVFIQGVALQSAITFSEKTSLTLGAERDRRSYYSDAAHVDAAAVSEDLTVADARLNWQATRLLSLSLAAH